MLVVRIWGLPSISSVRIRMNRVGRLADVRLESRRRCLSIRSPLSLQVSSLACAFHETYERPAPSFGYETGYEAHKESGIPWDQLGERTHQRST
jgi:hypothetical protein